MRMNAIRGSTTRTPRPQHRKTGKKVLAKWEDKGQKGYGYKQ